MSQELSLLEKKMRSFLCFIVGWLKVEEIIVAPVQICSKWIALWKAPRWQSKPRALLLLKSQLVCHDENIWHVSICWQPWCLQCFTLASCGSCNVLLWIFVCRSLGHRSPRDVTELRQVVYLPFLKNHQLPLLVRSLKLNLSPSRCFTLENWY